MAPSLLRTLVVLSLSSSPFFTEAQTAAAGATGGDTSLSITPVALSKTFPAGTQSPIPGAPPLPTVSIDLKQYPTLDQVPPTDSDVVKAWLSKIDMSKVPGTKPNGLNGCSNTTVNADAVAKAGTDANCWWTCGGCTRSTDITTCPSKGTFGASFDDGPSEYTPNVLKYLDENKLKATFFIVGSRAVSLPDTLRAEYMAGHQLCLHTWSHPSLTTLTNEQIVAEFAWSMKAFKDVLGMEPNCARPPYSDVDDRVRYILNAMGLKIILWTRTSTTDFDTNDWRVVDGSATVAASISTFQKLLTLQSSLPTGFIALTHDLFSQTVALSLNHFLPAAQKIPGLKIQSIADCLGQPLSASYFETAGTSSATTSAGNSSVVAGGTAKTGTIATATVSTNTSASSQKTTPTSGGSKTQLTSWHSALIIAILFALF